MDQKQQFESILFQIKILNEHCYGVDMKIIKFIWIEIHIKNVIKIEPSFLGVEFFRTKPNTLSFSAEHDKMWNIESNFI